LQRLCVVTWEYADMGEAPSKRRGAAEGKQVASQPSYDVEAPAAAGLTDLFVWGLTASTLGAKRAFEHFISTLLACLKCEGGQVEIERSPGGVSVKHLESLSSIWRLKECLGTKGARDEKGRLCV